jgi:hypothetical protein
VIFTAFLCALKKDTVMIISKITVAIKDDLIVFFIFLIDNVEFTGELQRVQRNAVERW